MNQPHRWKRPALLSEHKGAASVALRSAAFRAAFRDHHAQFAEDQVGRVFDPPSNPLNLNPKRMLLDLGYRQDFVLLLFGDFKGIGARDALTFRMDGQGQGQSI